MPVAFENDARALTLGEGWLGAAQGRDNYLALVVSTGIGGGIVLDGSLLKDNGRAGRIGHICVDPNGRLCECGHNGCLEAEASGKSIEAMTGAPAAEGDDSIIERTGMMVGRGIATVANLLDLDLALVGGSVALGYGDRFFDAARKESARWNTLGLRNETPIRIEPVGLGADAPLLGAAAVAFAIRACRR